MLMKTKFEEGLEEVLNLPVSAPIIDNQVIESPDSNDHDIESDYQYARNNLYGIIEKGTTALDELVVVAQASEHPRAYEVVSQLVKTLSEANDKLLKIQRDIKDLKRVNNNGPSSVTNALFVGNTSELQKLVKGRQNANGLSEPTE
jgi:hypothetical protein